MNQEQTIWESTLYNATIMPTESTTTTTTTTTTTEHQSTGSSAISPTHIYGSNDIQIESQNNGSFFPSFELQEQEQDEQEEEEEQQQQQDPNTIVNTMVTANNAFISSLDHLPCDIVRSLWIIQSLNLKVDRLKADLSKLIKVKDALRIRRKQINGIDVDEDFEEEEQESKQEDDQSNGDIGLSLAINKILKQDEIQEAKKLIFLKVLNIEKRIKSMRLEVFSESRHLSSLVKNHLNYIENDLGLMKELSEYKRLTKSDYNGNDARNWQTFCTFKKEFLKSIEDTDEIRENNIIDKMISPITISPTVEKNNSDSRIVTPRGGLKIRLNLNEINKKQSIIQRNSKEFNTSQFRYKNNVGTRKQLRDSSDENINRIFSSKTTTQAKGGVKRQRNSDNSDQIAPTAITESRRPNIKVTKMSSHKRNVQNPHTKTVIPRPPLKTAVKFKEPEKSSLKLNSKVLLTPEISISEDKESYCFCGGPSFGKMIACDNENCKAEWFHYKCVGLFKPPSDKQKWYCSPECYQKATSVKSGTKKRRRR